MKADHMAGKRTGRIVRSRWDAARSAPESAGVGEEVARSGGHHDEVGTEVVVVGGDAVLAADP
ncbi:hypothetical protein GCM10009788_58310 [Nocardioides humi]|jgi:hypothetical protein|uniref:Uncharacterized protein n=1 Tax=Nocardioides humi TaxID=449461 RepID=A0ABN2BWG7_9ACTN